MFIVAPFSGQAMKNFVNSWDLRFMLAEWQIDDLIALVQRRYPGWSEFDHPPFVQDELNYKHKAVRLAEELLSKSEVDDLLARWQYDELFQRALRLGRETNLLWLRVPRQGDLNLLMKPDIDKAELAQQLAKLWHGSESLPERVQTFGAYALERQLPLKWPFVSYFLFFLHPEKALFVKPTIIKWFLQFVGQGEQYGRSPSGHSYAAILQLANELKERLAPYGARDMIDIQSFLWVAAREAKGQTGRLTPHGQIELDVPQKEEVEYEMPKPVQAVAESRKEYRVDSTPLTMAELAESLCLPEQTIDGWVMAIRRKQQAILQGPPGTGKTFSAQLLAEFLVGDGDGFWELLQFHPNYAYEEFMQGIRPVGDSFELVEGRFLSFCRRAAERNGVCVLIIDEMNRAPLARVFGELMYLLEYRQQTIPLAGGGNFSIPDNVFLLGTMNSADRSIALVDFALRRRLCFFAT